MYTESFRGVFDFLYEERFLILSRKGDFDGGLGTCLNANMSLK